MYGGVNEVLSKQKTAEESPSHPVIVVADEDDKCERARLGENFNVMAFPSGNGNWDAKSDILYKNAISVVDICLLLTLI